MSFWYNKEWFTLQGMKDQGDTMEALQSILSKTGRRSRGWSGSLEKGEGRLPMNWSACCTNMQVFSKNHLVCLWKGGEGTCYQLEGRAGGCECEAL
ncbi:hypothetical protein A2U01_0028782 [Trifolium medium]|uniref:Uncharacterized protein n=1 Tax=Trifolium medium TaxID=97028 RepID=A0A392P6M6_9FABA|nr:hypothetical protein [Trifolium medium]